MSEFDVKRYRRHYAEEGILLGTGTGAILAVLEVDEEGVVAVIQIVDAENQLVGAIAIALAPHSTHVEMVR
jgi:hypothetical protein